MARPPNAGRWAEFPRRAATAAGVAAIVLALCGRATPSAGTEPGVGVRVVKDLTLVSDLRFVHDVRWAGAGSVYIAAGPTGLIEHPLTQGPFRVVVPPTGGRGAFDHPVRLGVAGGVVAVAAPFFSAGWIDVGAETPHEPWLGLDFVADLDAQGESVLILGARRDAEGEYSPDGALAWRVDRRRPGALEPTHFTNAPSVRETMASCGVFDVGVVRFLPDGSYVILPGVEPGLFRYSPEGRLVTVFDTGALGLDTDCSIPPEQRDLMLRNDVARHRLWINRRRIADEVLPWGSGFAVVAREQHQGRTRWTLSVVSPGGGIETMPLPFDSPSPYSHLRADLEGDRIAFLIFERGPEKAQVPARLIVAERS